MNKNYASQLLALLLLLFLSITSLFAQSVTVNTAATTVPFVITGATKTYTPTAAGHVNIAVADILADLTNIAITTVVINSGTANADNLTIGNTIAFIGAAGKTLRFTAKNTVTVNAAISSANALNLDFVGEGLNNDGRAVFINGTLTTNDGNINIDGKNSANFISVQIDRAINSAGGNITLKGTATNVGIDADGVLIFSTLTTTGTGKIDITGISAGDNNAVWINQAVQTANGDIIIHGTNTYTIGTYAFGVFADNASTLRCTGTGKIDIVGVNAATFVAVEIRGPVQTNSGDIILKGTATNAGFFARAVLTLVNGTLTTGTGKINITGDNAGDAPAVEIRLPISSTGGGDITIKGTNTNGAVPNARGVWTNDTGTITTTGTGKIDITGTNTGDNFAVEIRQPISAANGDIIIKGTATNAGNSALGVVTSGTLTTTGIGKIDITGDSKSTTSAGVSVGTFITTSKSVSIRSNDNSILVNGYIASANAGDISLCVPAGKTIRITSADAGSSIRTTGGANIKISHGLPTFEVGSATTNGTLGNVTNGTNTVTAGVYTSTTSGTISVLANGLTATSAMALSEANLNTAIIALDMVSCINLFAVAPTVADFSLMNFPTGTSITAVNRISDTRVEITLAYDDTDFDIDVVNAKVNALNTAFNPTATSTLTSGNLPITAVLEIPTDIILSANTIEENQAINTLVGSLMATGIKIATSVYTYTLVAGVGSTDNASFNIVGNNLRSSAVFNFLAKNSYTIRVRATDNSNSTLFFEKPFTINILTTICILYVRKDGNDANTGFANTAAGAKLTLQAAVTAATDGCTIVLNTGTYNEVVTVTNKGFTLQSVGNPIVQTIIMNGTGKTITLVGSLNISELVNMQAGTITSNGNLTLLSSSTQQGMALNGSGTITGDVKVQRYVTTYPARTTVQGYNYFSSPVSGKTITEFNDNVSLVLNPAYDFFATYSGAFPNFYKYIENRLTAANDAFEKGWESPASLAENLEVGRGYIVNLNANTLIDFFGILNNGNIDIPISRGTLTNSGWNLVGNPYPSALDWEQIYGFGTNNTKVASTILRRIATGTYSGTWAYYNAGVGGLNGGTKDIALGQGFFVRKTSVGNDNLNLTNAMRNANSSQFFRTEESEESKTQGVVKVKLTSQKWSDETMVYFKREASEKYEEDLDVLKSQLNSNPAPNLYTSVSGKKVAFNAQSIENLPKEIPLHFSVASSGQHEISLSELRNFKENTPIYLEDKRLNITQDLREKPYAFTANAGTDTARFVLKFEVAFTQVIPDESLTIYPNPAGNELKINIDSKFRGKLQIRLMDVLGREVSSQTFDKTFTQEEFKVDMSSLHKGTYLIEIQDDRGKQVRKIVKE